MEKDQIERGPSVRGVLVPYVGVCAESVHDADRADSCSEAFTL